MSRKFLPTIFVICALMLAAGAGALEFESCQLEAPGMPITREAKCASLEVPENPERPVGATIDLNIARVPARSAEPAADPVFLFAGGPGQAATQAYLMIARALAPTNRDRDIVLIDQRGTGESNPLDCPSEEIDYLAELDIERVVEQTRQCLEQLDGDPRFYTTTIAMRDYDRVRESLGYERINLLGISYGTRAAQTYLRLYPERVRSLVLDSVVPPQLPLGLEHAPNLDAALAKLFRRCAEQTACAERFGDVSAMLDQLVQRVREDAPELRLRQPTSGEPEDIRVGRDVVAVALRLLSYASETQALIPLLLDQARAGDWQPLAAQALMLSSDLEAQLARGMELSVICSEDAPLFPAEVDHDDTLMGGLMVDVLRRQCQIWPRGEVPGDFHQPLRESPVPALLLSGEYDPVTPPRYGEQAARQFQDAAHWVIPGRGHSVLRHGCLPEQVAAFYRRTDLSELDTECVERIGPAPFFLRPTGPAP